MSFKSYRNKPRTKNRYVPDLYKLQKSPLYQGLLDGDLQIIQRRKTKKPLTKQEIDQSKLF